MYYTKTQAKDSLRFCDQPHLPLFPELQKHTTCWRWGVTVLSWPFSVRTQDPTQVCGCPRLAPCFSWDAWNTSPTSLEKSHLSGLILWLTHTVKLPQLPPGTLNKLHLHSAYNSPGWSYQGICVLPLRFLSSLGVLLRAVILSNLPLEAQHWTPSRAVNTFSFFM